MSKINFTIRNIDRETALLMIKKYHYSNTLPKINKHYLGFFRDKNLVGIVTLGYGTRPRHTIQRIFPSLDTKDYLEIGRMCAVPSLPPNSISQMLSQLIGWLKQNHPEIKILFSWADGMQGKPGICYQSSNFSYANFSIAEMYLKDGVKIHPRQMKGLIGSTDENDHRIGVRPTLDQMRKLGIDHYKGQQFRYLYFLCSKKEKEQLLNECACKEELELKPPKAKDITWKKRNLESGKWEACGKPPYVTDFSYKTKGIVDIEPTE